MNTIKEQIIEDGILIFEDLIPKNLIELADEELCKFINKLNLETPNESEDYIVSTSRDSSHWNFHKCQAHPKSIVKVRGGRGYDDGMLDIFNTQRVIDLNDILKNENLKNILRSLGKKVKNINTYCNSSILTTREYHRDSSGGNQFKAFIYLTDVSDESYGPYSYIKGTHTEKTNEGEIVHCTANKGSLIVSNQSGLHRGLPQTKGKNRRLISINLG